MALYKLFCEPQLSHTLTLSLSPSKVDFPIFISTRSIQLQHSTLIDVLMSPLNELFASKKSHHQTELIHISNDIIQVSF